MQPTEQFCFEFFVYASRFKTTHPLLSLFSLFFSLIFLLSLGEPNVVECAYVQSSLTAAKYFASRVRLGRDGAEEVLALGKMTDFEKAGLEKLIPELQESIEKGEKFVTESS